jgi:outer membrane biosynthesis protein TonB
MVTNSPFGSYDSALVKAIQNKWEALLKTVRFGKDVGKVVVRFKLHADGNISDVAVAKSEVNSNLTQLSQSQANGPRY